MSTLFVEAFGELSRDANLRGMILEEEEDLYSVFRERGELMRWMSSPNDRPMLWGMEEAELTDGDDASRIGWVQVGLNVGPFEPIREPPPPVLGQGNAPPGLHWRYESFGADRRASEPVEVLPALIQCFDDSLRRFGAVEVSGLPGDGKWHGDLHR